MKLLESLKHSMFKCSGELLFWDLCMIICLSVLEPMYDMPKCFWNLCMIWLSVMDRLGITTGNYGITTENKYNKG